MLFSLCDLHRIPIVAGYFDGYCCQKNQNKIRRFISNQQNR